MATQPPTLLVLRGESLNRAPTRRRGRRAGVVDPHVVWIVAWRFAAETSDMTRLLGPAISRESVAAAADYEEVATFQR
jgi:hypothetical protein